MLPGDKIVPVFRNAGNQDIAFVLLDQAPVTRQTSKGRHRYIK